MRDIYIGKIKIKIKKKDIKLTKWINGSQTDQSVVLPFIHLVRAGAAGTFYIHEKSEFIILGSLCWLYSTLPASARYYINSFREVIANPLVQ